NRIVTMYLDYAELQARRHEAMYMKDWIERLDAFLQFNEHEILQKSGKVRREVADKLATDQYEIFHQERLEYSEKDDFDEFIEQNRLK
ncbi:MAG: virulence RhuM family protein, partial [Erysipelothrix sp.]|nr:virulence RhuM family protein [Erysipelothrix sp.]